MGQLILLQVSRLEVNNKAEYRLLLELCSELRCLQLPVFLQDASKALARLKWMLMG